MVRTLAAAALSAGAVLTAGSAVHAAAASPGWGPDAIPYRTGIVCTGPSGSSALVAWTSAATDAPAYALAPVAADPAGVDVTRPAVDARTAAPLADPNAAALAALLARYGRTTDAATAGEVAAAVLTRGTPDPAVSQCLTTGASAAAAARTSTLWAEATRSAGPYTVRTQVAAPKLTLGRPATVSAVVTAASGAPVGGVGVSFGSGARLARTSAVTDAAGLATTSVVVPPGSAARSVRVVAHAAVPGTPVVMTEPGAVSLIAAGPDATVSDAARVPVDTTADPHLTTTVDRALVLPGTVVQPAITVTGLRGHSGTAQLLVRGPLPLQDGQCPTDATEYTRAGVGVDSTPAADVTRDGSYPTGALTLTRAGCYVLTSRLATTNAIPEVHRTGGTQIVTVAPVHVAVDPAGQGVSATGPVAARVRVTGLHARLTDVTGSLIGPQPSDDGNCTGVVPHGAATPLHVSSPHGDLTVTSAPVTRTGCYGFRVLGTVVVPGLGAVPLAWTQPATVTTFVLDPAVTVSGLSTSAVTAGEQLTAQVTVSGSWTQPGALHLQLRYLPYDWRGCFDRDWSQARTVGAAGPVLPTSGDGTYSVTSPAVPSDGCWTVVPTLTLSRNPAVSVSNSEIAPMTAFTGLPPQAAPAARQTRLPDAAGDFDQVVATGLIMLFIVLVALGWTLAFALRDE